MNRPCPSVSFSPYLYLYPLHPRGCLHPSSSRRRRIGVSRSLSLSFTRLSYSLFRSVCSSRISLSFSLACAPTPSRYARTVSAARVVRVRAVSPSPFRAYRVPPSLPLASTPHRGGRVSPVYVLLSVRLARFRARIARARAPAILVAPAQETAAFLSSAPQTWLAPLAPDRPWLCLVEPLHSISIPHPSLHARHPFSVPRRRPSFSLSLSLSRALSLSLSLSRPLALSLSRSFPPISRDTPPPRLVRYTWSLSLARCRAQVVGSLALCPSSGTHPPRAASSSAR